MKYLPLLVLLASSSAMAAEHKLTGPEITSALSDQVLTGKANASQIFQKSGTTFYSEGGSQSQGLWKVSDDQYCSQWPPSESWACYDVLQDDDKITFVSASGQRSEMMLPKPQ